MRRECKWRRHRSCQERTRRRQGNPKLLEGSREGIRHPCTSHLPKVSARQKLNCQQTSKLLNCSYILRKSYTDPLSPPTSYPFTSLRFSWQRWTATKYVLPTFTNVNLSEEGLTCLGTLKTPQNDQPPARYSSRDPEPTLHLLHVERWRRTRVTRLEDSNYRRNRRPLRHCPMLLPWHDQRRRQKWPFC